MARIRVSDFVEVEMLKQQEELGLGIFECRQGWAWGWGQLVGGAGLGAASRPVGVASLSQRKRRKPAPARKISPVGLACPP